MDSTGYITLSKQTALRRQMDIIAHNLANASTTSYRGETPMFAEQVVKVGDQRPLSFVRDVGIVRDLKEGPLERTGNTFDLALHGDGYFVVETPAGQRFTRNGHFILNAEGEMVTSSGSKVMDTDQRTIRLGDTRGHITISSDGTISSGEGIITRLKVVSFADPAGLQREADSLYVTDQRPQEPRDVSIMQGMLERSNVRPILEMTRMIEVHRSYQANSKLIETDHELQRKTIDQVIRA
jgi:flagellar basal-body rod protein FlgF